MNKRNIFEKHAIITKIKTYFKYECLKLIRPMQEKLDKW